MDQSRIKHQIQHVLTSRECLQMLKEKEEKKKQVQLEKERRKVERELKKKQKEEEQKVKAAEIVKQAAEREAAKAKREAAKAEKEAAREEKAKQKSLSGMKRSDPSDPRSSRVSKKILCMRMLITVVYALARTRRILIQGENGYSVFARGGYMRTVLMMKILIVMANCAPFVKHNTPDTTIQ